MYLGGGTVDESTLEYDSAACFEEGAKVSILGAMSYNYVEGGTGSAGGARDDEGGYDNVVQYPFGYGLSYGSFSQTIESYDISLLLFVQAILLFVFMGMYESEASAQGGGFKRQDKRDEISGVKAPGYIMAAISIAILALTFSTAQAATEYTTDAAAESSTDAGTESGTYYATLNTFSVDGTNPDPYAAEFSIVGKLSTPEFKLTQDGTNVTLTIFSDTLTTYMDKALTLDAGTYQITLTAIGDGGSVEDSDASETLTVTVADGTTSEVMTSGYVEQEEGMMP